MARPRQSAKPADDNRARVQFTVPFEEEPEQPLDLAAYVTDRGTGEVIQAKPIKEGRFELDLEGSRLNRLSIGIAPVRADLGDKLPTRGQLGRLRVYEPVFTFDPKLKRYELKPIPADLSRFWWLCFCRVRGRVVKPVTSGGVTIDMPVCHARVHICEVDPIWLILERLPDRDIFRLRDELLEVIERPIPMPPEPPWPVGPEPGPGPIGPIELGPIEIIDRELEGATLPPGAEAGDRLEATVSFAETAERSVGKPLSAQLSIESRVALTSPSAQSVRRSLIDNAVLIHPWICWWRWIWPWWWRCDEVAVVDTDDNGRFDVTISYPCDDQPDLYFWVEYFINNAWTTVYAPWRPCGTYWDFDCASEVTVRVTDPRVPYCDGHDSPEGKVVVIKTIGNSTSISEILASAAGAREGLTVGEGGFGSLDSPFAGTLELRTDFGDALFASGVEKYQWSYRQIKDAAGNNVVDSWHVMTRQIVRHYRTFSGGNPIDLPYQLGPNAGNFFEVWNAASSTTPVGNHLWQVDDAHEDVVSAFFETSSLDPTLTRNTSVPGHHIDDAKAGRYELKLELFHADNSLVDWTAEGIGLFEADVAAPFGVNPMTTQASPTEHRFLGPSGHTVGFRLVVHVDNSFCDAAIFDVTSGGSAAGPCGFIDYLPHATAHVSFLARHVHEYAVFWFNVVKGSSGEVAPASVDPWAPTSVTPANGFARNASSVWAKDIAITGAGSLVDSPSSCPDGRAAFAETIYVAATATDGWQRASWLDASATPKAFALNPHHAHP
jgi:hypothetical protein